MPSETETETETKPKRQRTPRPVAQVIPTQFKSPFVQVGSFVLGRHGAVHVQANAGGVAVRLFPAHTVQVDAPLSAFGYLIGTDPWMTTERSGWVTIGDHMVNADEHLVYAQRTPEGGATLHCRFRINDDGDHGMVQLHVASFEDVVKALGAEVVYTPPPVDPPQPAAAPALETVAPAEELSFTMTLVPDVPATPTMDATIQPFLIRRIDPAEQADQAVVGVQPVQGVAPLAAAVR
jgi:hypothetical protein